MVIRLTDEIINSMSIRRTAWDNATEMVVPIIEDHGLAEYPVGGNVLVPGSKMTRVDQNINHILQLADWLLEPLT